MEMTVMHARKGRVLASGLEQAVVATRGADFLDAGEDALKWRDAPGCLGLSAIYRS
jgi:hypothetical protein